MSFSVEMHTASISTINKHADAVAFYGSCREKGEYGEERLIKGKETSFQMGVRIGSNGDVLFRLHRTDVIIWHRNSSYTVNTYTSRSTDAFASAFMGGNAVLAKMGSQIIIGSYHSPVAAVHPIHSSAVVRGSVVKTDAVFTKEAINRKAAEKVLAATRYAEYRKWYNAMWPMVWDSIPPLYGREYLVEGLAELISDPDAWHRVMVSQHGSPNNVRRSIYTNNWGAVHDTVTKKTLPRNHQRGWQVTPK
jgi:hypothetical protein|tara:strand:- start:1709 stop:2455 length:747 start_codon:yes stop_codon:yes gene_type:complete